MTDRRAGPESLSPVSSSDDDVTATDAGSILVPSTFSVDRRKNPRVVPHAARQVELSVVMDIEVLDLSESGVLLACDYRLDVGYRMQVRILLGNEPFVAWLEVRRVAVMRTPSPGSIRFLVGAAFVSLDGKSACALRQFLPSRTHLLSRRRGD